MSLLKRATSDDTGWRTRPCRRASAARTLIMRKCANIPHGQKSNDNYTTNYVRANKLLHGHRRRRRALRLRPARGAKQRTAGRHLEAIIRPAA
ncbi:hypothetical protein EVAR_39026_1 [Eumeta japonica]|uniref:Uncharacterized protein n=1 Tax=Eumeta variegata TaxID=151549 RepID=A0A4C1WQQ5_EUMVA|nr:hypothetical protein EVAR_39026_1 [Eumeta japonica]